MRYFIKIKSVEEKIVFMQKELENISENIKLLEKNKEQLEWFGDAACSFYNSFDDYLNKLRNMEHNVNETLLFLVDVYDKYYEKYNNLNKKYVSILDSEAKNG